MSHKADCPFCEAFAVEVPGPSKELLWQLPADSPLKQVETVTRFEDGDPVELLRLCAETLENVSNWYIGVVQARANWLRRFASHLEEVREP